MGVRHLTGVLVVVSSAAIVAILAFAHPAAPLSALASSSFAGTNTNLSGCSSCEAPTAILTISPTTVAPGEYITISGAGFKRCTLRFGEKDVRLLIGGVSRTFYAANGMLGVTYQVPPDMAPGKYGVVAACAAYAGDTSPVREIGNFVVTSSSPSPSDGNGTLPGSAGGSAGGLAGGSAAVVGFAGLLWFVARGRKGRRDIRWVREHLRAVAEPTSEPPSAEARSRPGGTSRSVAFQLHDDNLRHET